MSSIDSILGQGGAIARRLGDGYEVRPQQLELAYAVETAFAGERHLLAEAGTGVGKSFAYLLPAIDFAVQNKKRVVISTHTISLQEQLMQKDIPLLQSVYGDEFSAVLVKGRGNYVCHRRLDQAIARQHYLFDRESQFEQLTQIADWAEKTGDGSLSSLPVTPEPGVWERVNAEQGNCLGKKCNHYAACHWQAAKRRMQGGQLLIVNHALFFSDLALRMAGVNYLPKYDAVVFDEAHTIEDVAGQHFGLKVTEGNVRYQLRTLYDLKKGRGILSTHGSAANDAIRTIVTLDDLVTHFFDAVVYWQDAYGRGNGRVHEANVIDNPLSPALHDLGKHLKTLISTLKEEEDISELLSLSARITSLADTIAAIVSQSVEDCVYWFEVAKRTPRRVSLHAAPIDVAEGLRRELFGKCKSAVLTSATLATAGSKPAPVPPPSGGVGIQPTRISRNQSNYLPHLTITGGIYHVIFRLGDSVPASEIARWRNDLAIAERSGATMQTINSIQHRIDGYADANHGECLLRDPMNAQVVQDSLHHFTTDRYDLLAWAVMPNHVHVAVRPLGEATLPALVRGWKSYTSTEINRRLGRNRPLWAREYYDHLVRSEPELTQQLQYIDENPAQAGIDSPWHGIDENAVARVLMTSSAKAKDCGLNAHSTAEKTPTDPTAFDFIRRRLGLDDADTLQLGSPFDYASQATLYIENDLPDPSDTLRFLPAACEKILKYIDQTQGGAFVLFTSHKMLTDAANLLKTRIDARGYPLLVQGYGMPRGAMLDQFRTHDDAVLFGTSSFWQGIDVRGEKLRNVIIVKLPFSVPDEPLTEAKLEAIRRRGGNPFMDLSVPEAVIKLKQGFGRLIRSKTDRGIVVILDNRVRTKRYGGRFLEALPPCRVIDVQ